MPTKQQVQAQIETLRREYQQVSGEHDKYLKLSQDAWQLWTNLLDKKKAAERKVENARITIRNLQPSRPGMYSESVRPVWLEQAQQSLREGQAALDKLNRLIPRAEQRRKEFFAKAKAATRLQDEKKAELAKVVRLLHSL